MEKIKIKVRKLEDVVLIKENGVREYLWALSAYNRTLIQVYSPTEPTEFIKYLQDIYDKH